MQALVETARRPDYPAEIALVVSNRPTAPGLAFAKAAGLATAVIDHKIHAGREDFDRAIDAMLTIHRIELVCLAGFMRLLTPWFVHTWHQKIINIHPALLPSFKGLHTHVRALEAGVKVHGCTVHFVVPTMDEGPIIAQAALAVRDHDTEESLARRVLDLEHCLYPQALALVARDALIVDGTRVALKDRGKETTVPLIVPPLT